jgi:hypothetical protein
MLARNTLPSLTFERILRAAESRSSRLIMCGSALSQEMTASKVPPHRPFQGVEVRRAEGDLHTESLRLLLGALDRAGTQIGGGKAMP